MSASDTQQNPSRSAGRTFGKIAVGVFALDAVYAAGRSIYRNSRSVGDMVFGRFVGAFRGWTDRFDFDGVDNTPSARFQRALELSDNTANLGTMISRAHTRLQFWLMAAILFTAVAVAALKPSGLAYAIVVGQHGSALGLIMPFCLAFMMWTKAFKWSFWAYQLRRRELVGVGTWLFDWKGWLPPDMPVTTGMKILVVGAVGGAIAQHTGIGIHEAFAQAASGASTAQQAATVGAGQTLSNLGAGGAAVNANGSSVFQSLMGNLSQGDLSMQWMEKLFPSFFSGQTGVSYSQDAVAQMMQVVNTTLVGMGSLLMGWHTVAGITSTAHDGQVLGQRWHTIWAPLRIGLGVAGTFPVMGFCAGELLAIQLILSGCGLANLAWSTYVNAATGATNQLISITVPPDTFDNVGLFNTAVQDAVCVKTAQYTFLPANDHNPPVPISQLQKLSGETGWADSGPLFNDPSTGAPGTTNGNQQNWSFGSACGKIAFSLPKQVSSKYSGYSSLNAGTVSNTPQSAGNYSVLDPNHYNVQTPTPSGKTTQDTAVQKFVSARNTAFNTFLGQVMNSAYVNDMAASHAAGSNGVADKNMVNELSTLRTDYVAYEHKLLSAAASLQYSLNQTALNQIAQQAGDLGWADAGALEPSLVAQGARVSAVLQQQPTLMPGSPGLTGSKVFSSVLDSNEADTARNEHWLIYDMPALAVSGNGASTASGTPGGSGISTKSQAISAIVDKPKNFMNIIGQFIGDVMANPTNLNNLTPIQSIASEGATAKYAGYSVLAVYYAVLGISEGIKDGGKALASAGPIGRVVSWFVAPATNLIGGIAKTVVKAAGTLVQPFALWLIIGGALLEYVLPILGYIMWVFAIVGYVLFSLELVLGTSFWAFSHIRADGNELIDAKQSFGYTMLLVAVFYPTLMVIGLIFANVAMSTLISFVSATFDYGTQMLGTVYDPFGIAILLTVKVILYFQIVIRSYRLITAVPEFVFQYMGAQGPRGNDGHQMGERLFAQSRGHAQTVGTHLGGAAASSIGGPAAGAAMRGAGRVRGS